MLDRLASDLAGQYQNVERGPDGALRVTVLPRPERPATSRALPIADPALAPFLQPTPQIRSNDPAVAARAREIAGGEKDAWAVARKLADWTHANLEWKRTESGDATRTLATREADCSEFSELYIAMARSLGLPARIVHGLAFDGSSFGGHAWVEVYTGEWIELDPTWGTELVPAGHLRSSGELLAYASLGQLDVEVTEAPRRELPERRDPRELARALCEDLSRGSMRVVEDALDPAVAADAIRGAGFWAGLSPAGRETISRSCGRVAREYVQAFAGEGSPLRVASMRVEGDEAVATLVQEGYVETTVLRLRLVRAGSTWALAGVTNLDTGVDSLAEILRPALDTVSAGQRGGTMPAVYSSVGRVLVLVHGKPDKAIEVADRGLAVAPANATLRYLRALALSANDREDEALVVWRDLAEGEAPYAPALMRIAEIEGRAPETRARAAELYERYARLLPDDPRAPHSLALLVEKDGDLRRAEAYYRAAIVADPGTRKVRIDFAHTLAKARRFAEALALVDEAAKAGAEDAYSTVISYFFFDEDREAAEALVAADPQRLERDVEASRYLALIRLAHGAEREAVTLLERTVARAPENLVLQVTLSDARGQAGDWKGALVAASAAVKIDAEDGSAHRARACALAQLGRTAEALTAIQRAVELDEEIAYDLAEDDHLKPLAGRPEFKKLLPAAEE